MCEHLISFKLDDIYFIKFFFNQKDMWRLIATCHHVIGVLKWTCVKWSMNVPWSGTCHHSSGRNFNN
jgi:hypothetical protein